MQAIEEATSEEELKNQDQTLVTLDVDELLVIWRELQAQELLVSQGKGPNLSYPMLYSR